MATITVPDENRTLRDPAEIAAFLQPFGIQYECWDVAGRLGAEATSEEILSAYAPEIERLKAAGGYVTADVINVTPETPGLDAMLNKFNKEHIHTEDEVRFIVAGRGVFHIHPENGPVFGIEMESGDLINVPRGIKHWFDLCNDHRIRAIRLFQDPAGWTPHYTSSGLDAQYEPVCWGPTYLKPERIIRPAVQP